MTNKALKVLFFAIIVRPLVLLVLGLNIRFREKLPLHGPAVLAPNHNSHLDTLVLMSLFPLSVIHKVRPVAAADYFLKGRIRSWFALNIIGIIPLERKKHRTIEKLFVKCEESLNDKDILILFPEGSRGVPEQMQPLKKGIYHLVKNHQNAPVIPIVMHGLGKSLPKGEALFVPFNCDVVIGDHLTSHDAPEDMLHALVLAYNELYKYCLTRDTGSNAL